MKKTLKNQIYHLIDPSFTNDTPSRVFNFGMLGLIFLNVVAVILATERSLFIRFRGFFILFEVFSVAVFTIEYVLRLWTCTEDPEYQAPVFGRIRFALQPMMLIDLVSILPFFVPRWGLDLRIIRAVRFFRLFRLLKMGRYSQSLTRLGNVIKSKKEELSITIFAGLILLIIASSLMYFVEHNVQPEAFGSIPDAMWWGAITLTTVGYGDVYPVTTVGKIIGAAIAVLGIGLFALPAGIIASGFAAELGDKSQKPYICPHCGKEIHPV